MTKITAKAKYSKDYNRWIVVLRRVNVKFFLLRKVEVESVTVHFSKYAAVQNVHQNRKTAFVFAGV